MAERGDVLLVAPQTFFKATGTPFNVYNLSRALIDLGYAVDLATFPHGDNVDLPGLQIRRTWRLPLPGNIPVGFSATKLLYDVLLAGLVLRLLMQRRYVGVQAFEEAAFFAVPLARLFRTPGIADLDSDLAQQLNDHPGIAGRVLAPAAVAMRRLILRWASCAVTVAPYLTGMVKSLNPSLPVFEIRDIPSEESLRAPDPAVMERLRGELRVGNRPLVVYTGNFDRRQGLELLVDGWQQVVARHKEALLLLVGGEDEQIEKLRQRAARTQAASSIRFVGQRPPELMSEVMGLASVLVSPRIEPHVTPLKIFNYMASGRPIVATDLPTHSNVLDAASAYLTPATAAGLADGINRALDDPDDSRTRGLRARQLVLDKYSYEGFKASVGRVYQLVTSGAAG
ncbi:MAG: glycosyltransferase family 4 protein [Geminicoccaceae bacterium]